MRHHRSAYALRPRQWIDASTTGAANGIGTKVVLPKLSSIEIMGEWVLDLKNVEEDLEKFLDNVNGCLHARLRLSADPDLERIGFAFRLPDDTDPDIVRIVERHTTGLMSQEVAGLDERGSS